MPALEELEVADEPADWRALGFEVEDGACQVSSVRVRLVGKRARRGILDWKLGDGEATAKAVPPHPNGVARIDHVVFAVSGTRADGGGAALGRLRAAPHPRG